MDVDLVDLSLGTDCPCTLETCPSVIAARRLAMLQPRQAVAIAAKEPPDSMLLFQIAVATLSDSRYRQYGATKVFIQHILQQQKIESPRTHWEYSLVGLINIYVSIFQSHSEIQNASILEEIYSSWPKIVDTMSKDYHLLTPPGKVGDARRTLVSKFLLLSVKDARIKRLMYDDKPLKLALHCWLETGPDLPTRKSVSNLIIALFSPKDVYGNDAPEGCLEIAFNAVKVSHLTSRMNFLLKQKALLGFNLGQDIWALRCFIQKPLPFGPHFRAANIQKQVVLAMRRQLKTGPSDDTDDVLSEGELFIQSVIPSSRATMTVFTDLLVNTDIVEVAATALKIANKSWPASKPPNSAGSFYAFFGNVQHSMTCEKGAACTFHATPQFLQAARTSLERFGIPTLIALQEDVGAGGKYLDLWTSLAKLLGITKEAVRQRYRLDRKCCNLTCPARNSGTHTARKSLCSECESVYYCDRTCQKSDWSHHKSECKILKKTAWVDEEDSS